MGSVHSLNICRCFHQECYLIEVKTGDFKGLGTLHTVYITLISEDGQYTECQALSGFFLSAFKKGKWDRFAVLPTPTFEPIYRIIIARKDSLSDEDWYLDKIRIARHPLDTSGDIGNKEVRWRIFPVNRWIKSGQYYSIDIYDCSLPQYDFNQDQRLFELNLKQMLYQFSHIQGLPAQASEIPQWEIPSDYIKLDVNTKKLKIQDHYGLHESCKREMWASVDSFFKCMKELASKGMTLPSFIWNYQDDDFFVFQRLAGCLPNVIEACEKFPEGVSITPESVDNLIDGMKLEEALEQNRLFHVHHEMIHGISYNNSQSKFQIPYALFYYSESTKNLKIIAIQFYDPSNEQRETFTPNDGTEKWTRAKVWFNLVDSSIHRSAALIGCSYMILESIAISIHRTLSPSHLVFRMLMEAIGNTFKINNFEVVPMTKKNGFLDKTTSIMGIGTLELIHRAWSAWRMDIHGWLPADLEKRKVHDPNRLFNYPFRDDASMLFEAFKEYVNRSLKHFYTDDTVLMEDWEIQNWAKELISANGCNLKGVFGDGKFDKLEDLSKTVTSIYYQSLVLNLALTIPQYNHYGGILTYPSMLRGVIPSNKIILQKLDDMLPSRNCTMEIISTTMAISDKSEINSGNLMEPLLHHPYLIQEKDMLKRRFADISSKIKSRNKNLRFAYSVFSFDFTSINE